MGFDNECIVNIQSLAGEYFCPVCRTLVYPNEALQSQCTHLYCKLCLTYIVGTTKACPYDGYLVTEKDSKPLVESDKALAERIGKILVHCLFHRSGCSWQGPLSECTSHCSGCSFGNFPVVCNRCGVQIIHRQVQEHAQNCAGANPHVQQTAENSKDAAAAVAVTTANSGQASSQPVVHSSQAPVPQISTAPPTTQDANPHVQAISSSAGMTAEQWQQFQQYHQQYPGYNPYQQYYPYQQPAQQVLQHAPYAGQPQAYAQHPTAMQGHQQPLPQVQGQGPAQTQPQPQGQPQAQSFVQNQVNPQQQSHIQVHTQTAAQGQIFPQQPYSQAQPHLLPNSMQPPAQPNLQAPYQQAPFQGNMAQLQLRPQPFLQSQPQSHPYPHPLQPNNPPIQQPAPSFVPGYQSHPPVQPHYQMLQAPQQQYSIPMHPSSGPFPPSAQFPQQSPHIRPPQTNASLPNLQQPNQMPSQSQIQGVPPAQHPQTPQEGYIGHQRPAGQPMKQPLQQYGQQPFPSQASISVPSGLQPLQPQSQPQGPTQSQQSAVTRPPPPTHGSVQAHGMEPQQPPSYGSRPIAPNQTAKSHPFPQSAGASHSRPLPSTSVQPSGHQIFEGGIGNQQQVPSGQQFSHSDRAITHTVGEGNAASQGGPSLNKTAGNDVSGPGEDSVRVKVLESEIRGKSGDEGHKITSEGEDNKIHKGTRSKVAEAEVDALRAGFYEPLMKKIVKEETATLNGIDGSVYAAKQAENSSAKDSTLRQTEAYVGHKKDDTNALAHEKKSIREQVSPHGPAVGEYAGFQDKGLPNSSNSAPLTDQGRYHMPSGPYGPSSQQQRPSMPSNSQSGSYPGAPPNEPPGQVPAHLQPQGPGFSGPLHQSLHPSEHFSQSSSSHTIESFQGVQRGQYFQNNCTSQPPFSKTIKAEPAGPLHGSDGVALLQSQRLHHLEGRYADPHVSGSFDRGLYKQPIPIENRVPGFEAASGLHVINVNDEHRNQFQTGPAGRIGQGEYAQTSKQFSKPPPTNFGNGSFGAGETPSKFLPPYHSSGTFVGERPSGTQPDLHGSGPGFGVDHLPPRREFHGIPSRGFGSQLGGPYNQPGRDNVHGRATHAVHEGPRSFDIYSDPVGKPLRDHFRRGEMAGQDFIPNHLRRGELFDPKNVASHFRAVEGFGTFPDPRMGELNGHGGFPYAESFVGNKSNHPRLGEPGFRSSFSLHESPSSGGFYAGNLESIDRFRNRMPNSMGWCRICKVNCDSVDGLDLHSQTTEHQQRTMDMVISIKQNAKRQKFSKNHSSVQEGIRSRNAGKKRRGNKG